MKAAHLALVGRSLSLSWYHSWHVFSNDSRNVSFFSLSMIPIQNLAANSEVLGVSTTLVKICRTSSM